MVGASTIGVEDVRPSRDVRSLLIPESPPFRAGEYVKSFFDDSFKYSFKDKVSGKEKVGLFFRLNPINLPNKESDKAMLVRAREFDIFSINSSDILLNNVLVESV